jgi:hypothetical protein
MTATDFNSTHRPAPRSNRVKLVESLFGLLGGPIAWYLQLCSGYALASEPCFRAGHRTLAPPPGLHWTWSAMILLMTAAVAIALVSLLVSWRAFKRTRADDPSKAHQVMQVDTGRKHFLALWGMLLGSGFALAVAITAVAFVTVPRCAG